MEIQPFLDDRHDQINGNSNPDLGLHGVFRSAEKTLDAQMLFDPFEEVFHLPSLLVELGDGDGGQKKVVGQKHQGFVGPGIVISYPAEFVRIIPD